MMTALQIKSVRTDCLASCAQYLDVISKLKFSHIAITGGTGFLGTWLAEMVATLNDEYSASITLDLYARNIKQWSARYLHLSSRPEIKLHSQDVRSSFQFNPSVTNVIHAAGMPDNRIHSSNPLRVYQTTVYGIVNALDGASELQDLKSFLNVSSGLVNGTNNNFDGIVENQGLLRSAGALHDVYIDAKRSAESLATIYRSQFQMPVITVRPFTFIGPYQELDRPWAVNNFFNDILSNRVIRINGDGQVRRSYLYGSDAAMLCLVALVNGAVGDAFNIGSARSVSHKELAILISQTAKNSSDILLSVGESPSCAHHNFFPNMDYTFGKLNINEIHSLESAIEKTIQWFLECKM